MSNKIDILIEVPYLWLNDGYGQTSPLVIWQIREFCERHGLTWAVVRAKILNRNGKWEQRTNEIASKFVNKRDIPESRIAFRYHYPFEERYKTDKLVLYTMFETDRCPEGWPPILNTADLVLVPSPHLEPMFAKALNVPVKTLYLPLNEEYYELRSPDFLIKNLAKKFTYSFVGTVGQTEDRKGIRALTALLNENPLPPNAEFVIKSRGSGGARFSGARTNSMPMDTAKLIDFYRASHCGAYPSRGEGFGLPQIETSLLGRPVIVADNSAVSWSSTLMPWVVKVPCTPGPAVYRHASILNAGNWGFVDMPLFRLSLLLIHNMWENERDAYLENILNAHNNNALREELSYTNIQKQLDEHLLPLL